MYKYMVDELFTRHTSDKYPTKDQQNKTHWLAQRFSRVHVGWENTWRTSASAQAFVRPFARLPQAQLQLTA